MVRKQLGRNFAKLLIENTNEMQTERKNRVRALVSANFGRNSDITAKTSAAQQQKPANKKKNYSIFSICSLLCQFAGLLQHVHIAVRPVSVSFLSEVHVSCAYIHTIYTHINTNFVCMFSCLVKLALNSLGNYRVSFVSWALFIWKYVCKYM